MIIEFLNVLNLNLSNWYFFINQKSKYPLIVDNICLLFAKIFTFKRFFYPFFCFSNINFFINAVFWEHFIRVHFVLFAL